MLFFCDEEQVVDSWDTGRTWRQIHFKSFLQDELFPIRLESMVKCNYCIKLYVGRVLRVCTFNRMRFGFVSPVELYLPLICLCGTPPTLSWDRHRASTRRKMWNELAERYSWVCPGEWRGDGSQQLRACCKRDRGVLHKVPRPLTPSHGTVNEAPWGSLERHSRALKLQMALEITANWQ